MSEWKTMLEVARDLGVSKRVIKYHKEKLSSADKRVENGVIVISPRGIEQLSRFVRPKEYTQGFEKEVLKRLETIENKLGNNVFDNGSPKEVIRSIWGYLLSVENIFEILKELQKEASSLSEYDFYSEIADLFDLELKRSEFWADYDSEGNRKG